MKGILHPILAPLSGRWATSDCLLLSLLFTCSLNRHWARCCCNGGKALFLIPLLPRVHLNHLEVASLARWATVCCSSWGSKSLTGMGNSSFWFQLQLQLEPWRQVLPIGTRVLSSVLWQCMLLRPQLSAKIYHGVSIHECSPNLPAHWNLVESFKNEGCMCPTSRDGDLIGGGCDLGF